MALLSIAGGALLYLFRPESEHKAIERTLKLAFPLAVAIFAITMLFRRRR